MNFPRFAPRSDLSNPDYARAWLLSGKSRFTVTRGDQKCTYRVSQTKDTPNLFLVSYVNTANGINTFNYAGRVLVTPALNNDSHPMLIFELTPRSMIRQSDLPYVIFNNLINALNAGELGTLELHAA